jgi:putative selenium metabolism hydrolase
MNINALLQLCKDVIRQPSLSGQENKVAKIIQTAMQDHGYDIITIDDKGNLIGIIEGKRPGKTVLMDGHIDTVDISDRSRWIHDPYGAQEEDGKIYGRGTSDMKGAVCAMVAAAASFAAACKKDFSGKICVSCSVHEECFEGIATRDVSKYCHPDYVIIGEASNLTLKIGQRGRAEIYVETVGKTCHSSNPEKGINAVMQMMRLIEKINALPTLRHPILGEGILALTDIISSPYPGASVIPGLCRATFDRRLLVGETKESILAPIKQAIQDLGKADPTFKANCGLTTGQEKCYTGAIIEAERFFPAWLLPEEHELVQKAKAGLKSVGIDAPISHYSFCTNGSHFCGEAQIPTIGFGPSLETLAHTVDEYIEINQLCRAYEGYKGILNALCM